MTEQVTETSSPQLAGSSPKAKGSICGATGKSDWEKRDKKEQVSVRDATYRGSPNSEAFFTCYDVRFSQVRHRLHRWSWYGGGICISFRLSTRMVGDSMDEGYFRFMTIIVYRESIVTGTVRRGLGSYRWQSRLSIDWRNQLDSMRNRRILRRGAPRRRRCWGCSSACWFWWLWYPCLSTCRSVRRRTTMICPWAYRPSGSSRARTRSLPNSRSRHWKRLVKAAARLEVSSNKRSCFIIRKGMRNRELFSQWL